MVSITIEQIGSFTAVDDSIERCKYDLGFFANRGIHSGQQKKYFLPWWSFTKLSEAESSTPIPQTTSLIIVIAVSPYSRTPPTARPTSSMMSAAGRPAKSPALIIPRVFTAVSHVHLSRGSPAQDPHMQANRAAICITWLSIAGLPLFASTWADSGGVRPCLRTVRKNTSTTPHRMISRVIIAGDFPLPPLLDFGFISTSFLNIRAQRSGKQQLARSGFNILNFDHVIARDTHRADPMDDTGHIRHLIFAAEEFKPGYPGKWPEIFHDKHFPDPHLAELLDDPVHPECVYISDDLLHHRTPWIHRPPGE